MSDPKLEKAKAEIIRFSHKIAAREWVANHDGNLSVRLDADRFLLTPTGMHKGELTHADLIVVDRAGAVLEGTRKPFSEWDLHRAAYEAREDVRAVIHAHPPTACGFALAGIAVESTALAETVVTLGREIPLVPFAAPKSGTDGVSAAAFRADVMLLDHHGVLALGPVLETAYLRLELVEHQARIQLVARQLGGFATLPAPVVEKLLDSRRPPDDAGRRPSASPPYRAGARPPRPPLDHRPRHRRNAQAEADLTAAES